MHPLMTIAALLVASCMMTIVLGIHIRDDTSMPMCFLPASNHGAKLALRQQHSWTAHYFHSQRNAHLRAHESSDWDPKSPEDLAAKYGDIFAPSDNRNAASHLWAEYILSRAGSLAHSQIQSTFSWFCPVSGSPLSEPSPSTRYKSTLGKVGGGTVSGLTNHCCWPCICDTVDLIKVDTKTITDKSGVSKQYNFTVIGNPCQRLPKRCTMEKEHGCLPFEAPAVECEGTRLKKAILSDKGAVIIGMYFPASIAKTDQFIDFERETDEAGHSLKAVCADRKSAGYNSGMGAIFQQVAQLNPL